ncbi:AAA family ATPase [Sphingomonas sp. C8-2]|nr:AAA family ATPase [Sphingomonas sp. C8-2]
MSTAMLQSLDITNFRSIRGSVHAPLDAKVVLVHGENGAGKTSLLSAIELALTGRVIALERADPAYAGQLLQRGATDGRISLQTTGLVDANLFETKLARAGVVSEALLPSIAASFFSERCYLPQALLGQLLQIYQDSDSSPDSPLARFVTELLGLDRLDAIETGLGPVADLRNFRKVSPDYAPVESEKQRLDRMVSDHQQAHSAAQKALSAAMTEIVAGWHALGQAGTLSEDDLPGLADRILSTDDDAAVGPLIDQRRALESLRRGLSESPAAAAEVDLAQVHRLAAAGLERWTADNGQAFDQLASRVAKLLPTLTTSPGDTRVWHQAATAQIAEALRQAMGRTEQASTDATRKAALAAELEVERKNLVTIDGEIALISDKAGTLAELLAEISGVIDSDICPVCDRNYAETDKGALVDHVHAKVTKLSGSAERLLALGRTRSTQQASIDQLVREEATLSAREMTAEAAADLARRAAELEAVAAELARLAGPLEARATNVANETAARRALNDYQARSQSRASSGSTLAAIAEAIGVAAPDPASPLVTAIAALEAVIDERLAAIRRREEARRKIRDNVSIAVLQLERRREADTALIRDRATQRLHDAALKRAGRVRSDGQTIKGAVEAVRAQIISRAFNERLNRLWRDLFIRLAPTEPFVPAFHIPTEPTHKLKPKLVTLHRAGGAGGTPGAMLSAGNLNTAALTLFVALHMTVAPQLPWLILDDPVQSMDDVHIAHFAALLRTLSKEHGRQVIVAVHDRQLFEYLRLELSPAYEEDSLLTLELSRNATRDTGLLPKRVQHKSETALRFAA